MALETIIVQPEGDDYLRATEHRLAKLPNRVVEDRPPFEIITRDSEVLHGTVKFVDLDRHPNADLPLADYGGQRYYIMIKNKQDELVAIRVLSLSDEPTRIFVTSHINVNSKYRNRGVASMIDKELIRLLQVIANERGKRVRWSVQNENAMKLDQYRHSQDADPAVIAKLELEQERWMALYGPNGKFAKRIFEPELPKIDIIKGTTCDEAISQLS